MSRIEHASRWMYRGIWGVLSKWFRVPEDPPTLPVLSGESLQSFRPSKDYLRYLKLYFWLSQLLLDAAVVMTWLALKIAFPMVGLWLLPLAIAIAVIPGIVGYLAIHLRFDTTWYVLSSRSLRIRSGIWVINEATITFENIQNVSVESGPIERIFGVANVVVDTAGGGSGARGAHGESKPDMHRGEISGVSNANEIRQLILGRLSLSRSVGLGDEYPGRSMVWSPEHLSVLSEIRDVLKG
jgi:membrane protein YdbS with pleckstrin-like domain